MNKTEVAAFISGYLYFFVFPLIPDYSQSFNFPLVSPQIRINLVNVACLASVMFKL